MTITFRIHIFAVLASLLVLTGAASTARAGELGGKKIFDAKKCAACHDVSGKDKNRTIKDQLEQKGPELWYSGSKFKPGFLQAWLSDPGPIRPMEYYSLTKKNRGDHPRLKAVEAAEVSAYLMTLKVEQKASGIVAKETPKGRLAFIKRYACYGCHEVAGRSGKPVGGQTGPSLLDAGSRLEPDWVYAYLANSKYYKPIKDMPEFAGIMTDADMREIAAYVASMKK